MKKYKQIAEKLIDEYQFCKEHLDKNQQVIDTLEEEYVRYKTIYELAKDSMSEEERKELNTKIWKYDRNKECFEMLKEVWQLKLLESLKETLKEI